MGEHIEMPGPHVMSLAGRDHPAAGEPRRAGHAGDRSQHGGLPAPDQDLHVGLAQIELGELTMFVVRRHGSGGMNNGHSSSTLSHSPRIERVQPTRSAITVAGIAGNSRNNSST
jgi:hypothetical protein